MSSPEIVSPVRTTRDFNLSLLNSSIFSSDDSNKLTCSQIQLMLETKSSQYTIIDNTGKHTSNGWNFLVSPPSLIIMVIYFFSDELLNESVALVEFFFFFVKLL